MYASTLDYAPHYNMYRIPDNVPVRRLRPAALPWKALIKKKKKKRKNQSEQQQSRVWASCLYSELYNGDYAGQFPGKGFSEGGRVSLRE